MIILHFAFCILNLPIIASVLGDDFLDGGNSALDHIVVGLLGGDMLEPNAGRGNNSREEVIVSAREADKLVADAHNEGEGDQTDARSGNDIEDLMVNESRGDEHIDHDRNEKHEDKEGGAAAGMESLLLAYVFNGQLKSLLVAEDRLVLRAVVHKGTADILHKSDGCHISDHYRDLDHARNSGAKEVVAISLALEIGKYPRDKFVYRFGEHLEKQKCKSETEHKSDDHNTRHHTRVVLFRFLDLNLGSGFFCGSFGELFLYLF